MTQLFNYSDGKLTKLDPDSSSETKGLQVWLADHPELLGGEEMDPNDPRRFLLIKREVHDASGYLDHLFIDQMAVPTFVEAKLASNTDSHRKVVGQLLDYASEAGSSWSAEKLAGWLAERCEGEGLDPAEVVTEFEPTPGDSQAFWKAAQENLRAGNVRLMFACDEVPPSLQRIVEFLNERMDPTEVLALEVQCLRAEGQRIYSSTLVGATERAQAIKGKARKPAVIPALLEKGALSDGQTLWLLRDSLPVGSRPADDGDERLKIELKLDESSPPKFIYNSPGEDKVEIFPSEGYCTIRRVFDPTFPDRLSAVHDKFAVSPGGQTLGDLAVETGAWPQD